LHDQGQENERAHRTRGRSRRAARVRVWVYAAPGTARSDRGTMSTVCAVVAAMKVSVPDNPTTQREGGDANQQGCGCGQRSRLECRRRRDARACSALTRQIAAPEGRVAGGVAADSINAEAGGALRRSDAVAALRDAGVGRRGGRGVGRRRSGGGGRSGSRSVGRRGGVGPRVRDGSRRSTGPCCSRGCGGRRCRTVAEPRSSLLGTEVTAAIVGETGAIRYFIETGPLGTQRQTEGTIEIANVITCVNLAPVAYATYPVRDRYVQQARDNDADCQPEQPLRASEPGTKYVRLRLLLSASRFHLRTPLRKVRHLGRCPASKMQARLFYNSRLVNDKTYPAHRLATVVPVDARNQGAVCDEHDSIQLNPHAEQIRW